MVMGWRPTGENPSSVPIQSFDVIMRHQYPVTWQDGSIQICPEQATPVWHKLSLEAPEWIWQINYGITSQGIVFNIYINTLISTHLQHSVTI